MMQISYFTEPSPARAPTDPNQDYVIAGPNWAVVLDGATPQAQFPLGCVHGVGWYVRQLAGALANSLCVSDAPLPDILADSIAATCRAHGGACDLSNRASPSSTVAILREVGQQIEYLILADSPMVFDIEGKIEVITDDRNMRIPDRLPETIEAFRNHPDGYWVASTNPDAAYHALTGSYDVRSLRSAALLTDGSSRWVTFGLGSWDGLLAALQRPDGPRALVGDVRRAETCFEGPLSQIGLDKRHDDATALLVTPIH